MRALLAFALLACACDTRAQPAAAAGAAPSDPDRESKELESCSRTADCADGLRCFENECRRTDRNVVGDYDAALGANLREGGDLAGAVNAYAAAAKAYDDKPPVDIDCAYGAVLADARADKEKAELAARVLHRCINVSPAGSPMREAALRQIALLDSVGFDPEHLSKPEPADVYLSKAPSKPKSDALTVTVAASPEPPVAAKSWPATQDAIKAERDALVTCWQKSFDATKQAALNVGVPVKSSYHDSGYDDEPGYYATAIDPKAAAPANDAEKCVRDAVTAALKNVKVGGADWSATVTVTVQ